MSIILAKNLSKVYPALGLDVNAQAAVREYNQRYQAIVLLTSHYMADITALCKRVLFIY